MSTSTSTSTTSKRNFHIPPAVQRELASLPETIRDQFLLSLEQISQGLEPCLEVRALQGGALKGILELKINGRPAFRLLYTLMFDGVVNVLAARKKTTNGVDKQLLEAATSRLKDFRDNLKGA